MLASSIAIRPALAQGEPASALKRVVLFNVKYSPNLGDGLLSECLERELEGSLPGCTVASVDLAGRTAYAVPGPRLRGAALAFLDRCPEAIRRTIARALLEALLVTRLRRHYRAGLAGADAVVVGGGNLLTDSDLNFPMKISAAITQARNLPVAVYAVGVSPRWSRTGKSLFARALERSSLTWACVRDPRSQQSWQAHFANRGVRPAEVVVDPGVLASLHYPPPSPRPPSACGADTGKIGFCVTDPLAVRYHSQETSTARLEEWYPAALRSLVEHGFEVVLFTNGSPEDRNYLQNRLHEWVRHAKGPVTLGQSFEKPADLAALVANCDAIVGHRMHACIAAYSFGVPAVGLRWDVKLDSFFELTGRSTHMLDPACVAPAELGRCTAAAIADRLDPAPLIARARREIADFARLLQNVGGGAPA